MQGGDKLVVRVVEEGDEARILSPTVGVWGAIPASGSLVGPGAYLGTLKQLNRTVSLEMPEGISGRIELDDPRRARELAHGETMFRLVRLSPGDAGGGSGDEPESASSRQSVDGLPALVAPTDGVFYLRPAPDAEPFVKVGQKVLRGHAVGLIEVMKTFNQILYDGADLPEEGTVVEILAQDGDEVSAGQPLLAIR